MASSLNKVQLIGRLGKDPEVRSTQTGKTVCSFSLATSEFVGRDADRKEKTEWHKIVVWDKLGQIAGTYLKKGRQVFIEGRITYREYNDKENIKRYVTEIIATNLVLLGSKDDGASASGGASKESYPDADYADITPQNIDSYAQAAQSLGGDDEVPF